MLLGLFLLIIALLFGSLFVLPFSLEVKYAHGTKNDDLDLILWCWRFLPIPVSDFMQLIDNYTQNSSDTSKNMIQGIINKLHLQRLVYLTKIFLDHSDDVEKFDVNMTYSTGDAALTGVATGIIWSGLGGITGVITQKDAWINAPQIHIRPSFGQAMFAIRLHCIFRIRLGHIIIDTLGILLGKGGR